MGAQTRLFPATRRRFSALADLAGRAEDALRGAADLESKGYDTEARQLRRIAEQHSIRAQQIVSQWVDRTFTRGVGRSPAAKPLVASENASSAVSP